MLSESIPKLSAGLDKPNYFAQFALGTDSDFVLCLQQIKYFIWKSQGHDSDICVLMNYESKDLYLLQRWLRQTANCQGENHL